MIRNSVKYVNDKDLKEFTSYLKLIYTSATEEQAYRNYTKGKTRG